MIGLYFSLQVLFNLHYYCLRGPVVVRFVVFLIICSVCIWLQRDINKGCVVLVGIFGSGTGLMLLIVLHNKFLLYLHITKTVYLLQATLTFYFYFLYIILSQNTIKIRINIIFIVFTATFLERMPILTLLFFVYDKSLNLICFFPDTVKL